MARKQRADFAYVHTAVWTGNEMIIWGYNDSYVNSEAVMIKLPVQTAAWNERVEGGSESMNG